jgi:hypothetical protein
MNGSEIQSVRNNGNFCVALSSNRDGLSIAAEGDWVLAPLTQRRPEKSISRTTFWWLVEKENGVNIKERVKIGSKRIWRNPDGYVRVASRLLLGVGKGSVAIQHSPGRHSEETKADCGVPTEIISKF